jgi:hypothetical protein
MKIERKKGAKGFKIVDHNRYVFWTIVLLSILLAYVLITINNANKIDDFESCIAAGNPAMESYPRQCRDSVNDNTYTEIIEDAWRLDEISLMKHKGTGEYQCFGCTPGLEGLGLCVDPSAEMELVEETESKYCGNQFEVLTYCSDESKMVDACIEIYQPVCGWSGPEIQCLKYPCASIYSNSCFACMDENVEYYTEGDCPE